MDFPFVASSAAAHGNATDHGAAGGHDDHHAPTAIWFMFFGFATGALARKLTKNTRIPYTILMFAVGFLLGEFHELSVGPNGEKGWFIEIFGTELANIKADYILYIFLPILIFESAFSTDTFVFKHVFWHSAILAGPGLVIASCLTALMPMVFYGWDFIEGLLFGAILSATDPVAVVALLKELGAAKEISTIIEGESLLNDGVAIVIFKILQEKVSPTGAHIAPTFGEVVGKFLQFSAGGPIVGWVMARISVFCLKHSFNDAFIEITVTLSGAYLTFYISEGGLSSHFHVSGVLALVAFGTFLSSRRHSISPEVEHFMHEFWEITVYWANTLIFLLVGVQTRHNMEASTLTDNLLEHWGWLALLYLGINVIRFSVLLMAYFPLQQFAYKLDMRNLALCGWGGLRGAVGLALSLIIKNSENQLNGYEPAKADLIAFHTSGIVMLTLVVNGVTTQDLVQALGLNKIPDERKQQMRRMVHEIISDEEKTLRVYQTDHLIADSHWDVVRTLTSRSIKDTYNEPGVILHVDHREKARLALLRAFKIAVHHQYVAGLNGAMAIRRLNEMADAMSGAKGEFFDPKTSAEGRHWMDAFSLASMPRLPILDRIPYIRKEIVEQFITHAYDMGTCFLMAMSAVVSKVDQFVAQRDLAKDLRERAQASIEAVSAKLQVLANTYDEIALSLKTKFAARLILNEGRLAVHHLEHEGVVEAGDAEVLTEQIEHAMVYLSKVPRRLALPDADTVLANISWYAKMDFATKEKFQSYGQPKKEVEGATIIDEGDKVAGLGIIIRGIVKIEDGDQVNFVGPGRAFNIRSVLTGEPAEVRVLAQTSVKIVLFDREQVVPLLKATGASEDLWQQYGTRIAGNILKGVLPYVLWESGKFKTHVEGGTLQTFADQEASTLWPKYEYLLLYGEGIASVSRKRFRGPSVLPTSEETNTETEEYIEKVESMKQAFEGFDEDHSGSIDEQELAQVLRHMGYNYSATEVSKLMYDVDTDGSGAIEFDEFLLLTQKMIMIFSKDAKVLQIPRHKIEKDEEEEAAEDAEEYDPSLRGPHRSAQDGGATDGSSPLLEV